MTKPRPLNHRQPSPVPSPRPNRSRAAAGRPISAPRSRTRSKAENWGRVRRSTSGRSPPASMSRAPRCGKRCSSWPLTDWSASRRARACSSRACRSTRCGRCSNTSANSNRCAPSSPRAASTTRSSARSMPRSHQCEEAAEHGGAAEYAVANTVFHEAIYAGMPQRVPRRADPAGTPPDPALPREGLPDQGADRDVAARITERSPARSRPATKRWPPKRCCCTCRPAPPASRSSSPRCR